MSYITIGGVRVHKKLYDAVNMEILPGSGVSRAGFWDSLGSVLRDFGPRNQALLRKRDALQAQIDAWILERSGKPWDAAAYTAFLSHIGYIVPTGPSFQVQTKNVDPEIATVAGPQLVVPVDNARFALNAANARWGSLLDAFYGTDAGPPETDGAQRGGAYNPVRGERVFEQCHAFLDRTFPLTQGASYNDVSEFSVTGGAVRVSLKRGGEAGLVDAAAFAGYVASSVGVCSSVLLKNNGLHVEIVIDRSDAIGSAHAAGVKDVVLEAALTAIADCEDSVSAVDAEDKAKVYCNWSGLMRGTLSAKLSKGGKTVTRALSPDKTFTAPGGGSLVLPGRSLLLVRNVGLHMYTDAVLTAEGQEVPEGILDAMVTALAALHDIGPSGGARNSRRKSMYVVKPKMHGPEEAAFSVALFARVEAELGLPLHSIKMGIMDEERRTTANLAECIRAAKDRCIFINTGFLDRTGDEIHTSFHLGAVLPKAEIKAAVWRTAYEDWNVDVGLAVGLRGVAQIGKGMWAKPDEMAEMLRTKGAHPRSGANCAWVPSPTAATLHVLHYHEVSVDKVQASLAAAGPRASLADILTPPMLSGRKAPLTSGEIDVELRNNLQAILGYVVRWVESGVGCSKVPDLEGVGLMEDRATLRIASQHVANWLHHGVVSRAQVEATFREMAGVVDEQNGKSAGYRAMAPSFDNNSYLCALQLVLGGLEAPNGLTEGSLTCFRRAEKAAMSSSKL